jgi:hypothetical protein
LSDALILCDEKKRAGGKIVKACVKIHGDLVEKVMISGDFFVDPAEKFEELLQELSNMKLRKDAVVTAVAELLRKKELEFSGVTIEDILEVLNKILQ